MQILGTVDLPAFSGVLRFRVLFVLLFQEGCFAKGAPWLRFSQSEKLGGFLESLKITMVHEIIT